MTPLNSSTVSFKIWPCELTDFFLYMVRNLTNDFIKIKFFTSNLCNILLCYDFYNVNLNVHRINLACHEFDKKQWLKMFFQCGNSMICQIYAYESHYDESKKSFHTNDVKRMIGTFFKKASSTIIWVAVRKLPASTSRTPKTKTIYEQNYSN